jgi:hypothetical protein
LQTLLTVVTKHPIRRQPVHGVHVTNLTTNTNHPGPTHKPPGIAATQPCSPVAGKRGATCGVERFSTVDPGKCVPSEFIMEYLQGKLVPPTDLSLKVGLGLYKCVCNLLLNTKPYCCAS